MQWLWISAVSLLSLFLLVLCWYFFSDYRCFPCPCHKQRYQSPSILTSAEPNLGYSSSPLPFAPSAPPSTPEDSPTVRLTSGAKMLHNIVYEENGIPTLDLHSMTLLEARSATQGFLHRQRALGSAHMQVITGRSHYSDEKKAQIKSVIRNILIGEGLTFREMPNGAAYLVYL